MGMFEHFVEQIRSAWRFRWIAYAVAFLLSLIGWAIVFALPDRYQADARVFVDTRTALKPALKGLTMEQDEDTEINYVRNSLLAGPQLEKIAVDTGVLAPGVTDERKRAMTLESLSERIALTVSTAGNQGDDRTKSGTIYSFEYTDRTRERALRVVDTLLNRFIEQTLGGKREGSQNAQKFLEAQIADYAQRLSAAEDSLATFKKLNVGLMPSDQGGYFAQLQSEVDAEKKAETDLSVAVSRREELLKQLHSDAAISGSASGVPLVTGPGIGSGNDTRSRIQETQAKLDELLLKFTDMHPDVIATRAALEELKQRRALEIENLRRGDAGALAASGAGNSPIYQSIQLELSKVDVEIAVLHRESAQHASKIVDLRKRLNTAPQVEAQFQQLNRDYDANKAEYTALLENFQKARLGEQADNAGTVRFEVVQPPTSPIVPVAPRRTLWLAEIWVVAVVMAMLIAYGLQRLRPVISSVTAVNQVTRFPVLGVVTAAFPSRQNFVVRRNITRFSAGLASLVIALAVALALNRAGVRLDVQSLKSLVKL